MITKEFTDKIEPPLDSEIGLLEVCVCVCVRVCLRLCFARAAGTDDLVY